MQLHGLRDLLLRKTENDKILNLTLSLLDEDLLQGYVIESLQKMAKMSGGGNSLIARWASSMNIGEPAMIHDMMSHHASHYKAAVKAGNQKVADQHAHKMWNMIRLISKSKDHGDENIHFTATKPHAWEKNKKTKKLDANSSRVKSGRRVQGTAATNVNGWNYTTKDFAFLQSPPHEEHISTSKLKQDLDESGINPAVKAETGAYPMENIKIHAGKGDKNGKFLSINDEADASSFTPHPYDENPVLKHTGTAGGTLDKDLDGTHHKLWGDYRNFMNSEPINNLMTKHQEEYTADPNAYNEKGTVKPEPIHGGVVPNTQPKSPDVGTKEGMDSALSNPDLDPALVAQLKSMGLK